MNDPSKLCYILMSAPKYRDMTPEEKERCFFLSVVLDGATMICDRFDFCATSPTWAPHGICFSKEAEPNTNENHLKETT